MKMTSNYSTTENRKRNREWIQRNINTGDYYRLVPYRHWLVLWMGAPIGIAESYMVCLNSCLMQGFDIKEISPIEIN